ncbi:alpha/beta hydrolase [Olleya sp. HaHaR_3_96]|uniref:alpha/beta hydrolase n=1 Tax=Olleya sp. HaHaR_3_96 TaxID=2745560 RepID=UPI001C4EC080|nr:alpha/beta hydrolase [Olleya sp. HaHaR_3_96]QXP61463.1 alpha/beta hydrolase [Olleya sp. HaHaR_3_96]
MKLYPLLLLAFLSANVTGQDLNYSSQDLVINRYINGTLLIPNVDDVSSLAIIIGGSGPTDKDGNQNFQKTNNIKKLAVGLTNSNITTFRFDKRIVKQIRENNVNNAIIFDDFVSDASTVIDYFKKQNKYKNIYVIGHDQGSLIGMLAAKDKITGFISLAGSALSIDNVILEQVEKTAPQFSPDTKRIFKILKTGKTTTDYPVALSSIFNIETQRFIINWMQYSPTAILGTLEMPILIINGTKDLQVSEAEAKLLKEASAQAELKIIKDMNHVLVTIEGDDLENSKSYNESRRPLAKGLLENIISFIKK